VLPYLSIQAGPFAETNIFLAFHVIVPSWQYYTIISFGRAPFLLRIKKKRIWTVFIIPFRWAASLSWALKMKIILPAMFVCNCLYSRLIFGVAYRRCQHNCWSFFDIRKARYVVEQFPYCRTPEKWWCRALVNNCRTGSLRATCHKETETCRAFVPHMDRCHASCYVWQNRWAYYYFAINAGPARQDMQEDISVKQYWKWADGSASIDKKRIGIYPTSFPWLLLPMLVLFFAYRARLPQS